MANKLSELQVKALRHAVRAADGCVSETDGVALHTIYGLVRRGLLLLQLSRSHLNRRGAVAIRGQITDQGRAEVHTLKSNPESPMNQWEQDWNFRQENLHRAQAIVNLAARTATASLCTTLTGKTKPDWRSYITDEHQTWTAKAIGYLKQILPQAPAMGLSHSEVDDEVAHQIIKDAKAVHAVAKQTETARKVSKTAGLPAKRIVVTRDHQGGFGMWFPTKNEVRGGTLNEIKARARAAGYTEIETHNKVSHRTVVSKVMAL